MKSSFISIAINGLFLLAGSLILNAQLDHLVPGKLIIQFTPGSEVSTDDIVMSYKDANLELERCLSEDLGIWLCNFNEEADKKALLRSMHADKTIAQVQYEHRIILREILPDDPSFDMQWALYNIGQSGGLTDADIDATKAWEISVNEGTTILGDTIIIAVIDDGFDIEHEDMNFWENRNEIPDNGIDDDGNGYIDDYYGWNAFTATGDIPERSHGTRVAGVAGAVGNNGIGICGVGWNCKVMPIAGSSTFESTVVAAFAYVYKMRKLYEETNGEKGAYIVVTNGSFGVDFGNPDNYPIWGMMYDSLGSLGILNAAATMNHKSNVDIVGDVPTNFESDYILAVTNTTNKDAKYDVAAWGPVSIDIGAPGSNILSTKTNNTYGYSTGTSLAAPQLSGSIALLFAAADDQFLQKYKESPGESAKFLKNIILDNVDTLSGFDTLCVSGGRLNVDHAVRALLSPRLHLEMDTLSIQLGQDSSANGTVMLTNLAGFELDYNCSFAILPGWISNYPAAGSLPEYGNENLSIGFRTEGLAYGTYYSLMEIRDPGGWVISLVLELSVIDDTGISDMNPIAILRKAYPNPFTRHINLSLELEYSSRVSVDIFNLSGELVESWNEHLIGGSNNIEWDAGNLPVGVYVVNVRGDGFKDQIKVIKTSR